MNNLSDSSVKSKIIATVAATMLAIALGAVDYFTGRDWAISAFYLLPICLAGWLAGRWTGFAVGGLCAAAWFLADMFSGAAYRHPLIPIWNALMLLALFIVVVWLLTEFRRSHYDLERTVEQRTAALKAEIDERKRLEHAKLQAERLALVGSMAAQVAHEIRNPLGAISLNLDLIGDDLQALESGKPSSGECQTLLRETRGQVLRIHHVLQDYLRFGRMPKSERADLSLAGLLDEKLGFVEPLLDEKRITLTKNLDPALPSIQADAEQIWEVVLNLVRNAVDAMPGGGSLIISAQRRASDVLVSVGDNGRGMTEDQVQHLFVPFYTTKSDGTGLGLAYAQQVITEHGGRINFTTRRGEGSTFTIQLPVAANA
jgi:signal transduction histidine kinase